jgi:aldose 1-epimerase
MIIVRRIILTAVLTASAMTNAAYALEARGGASIAKTLFGETSDSQQIELYTLMNNRGAVARIINYGATLTELHIPDRNGKLADVVLGFDRVEGYTSKSNPYFGATTGRVANRIAKGKFMLDGKAYQLAPNNNGNHLHGGLKGFSRVLWDADTRMTAEGPAIALSYFSKDGDQEYPGNLSTTVTYTLTHDNELKIEMYATTDMPTIVNLANHTYWNLAGHDQGNVLSHTLMVNAQRYTPPDNTLIPTGELADVAGTPFDFTTTKPLGQDLAAFKGPEQKHTGGGYDVNYVLIGGPSGTLRQAAVLSEKTSGRVMELWTTEPGMQLYTGNWLSAVKGKNKAIYPRYGGVCLETQKFPDSINHPKFPTVVLRPGETYRHLMVHRFGTDRL